MLQSLVDGKEVSQCIIVEDNIGISGRGLLKCFLNALSTRFEVVHLVLYDVSPSTFTCGLPPHIKSRLKIHDSISDPLGWSDVRNSRHHEVITMDTDLCQHLRHHSDVSGAGDVAVIIDSLDQLLLYRSPAYTCQMLHRLRQTTSEESEVRVVALLHADLHDDITMDLMRHSATSCVRVEQPKDLSSFNCAVWVLHKRASGKIIKSHEQFTLTSDLTVEDETSILQITPTQSSDPVPDPTAGITFNLSLSEGEREARSRLVLPYTRPQARHTEPAVGGGSAKIFYQPDDADDFDEEDPDDDLDI